MAAPSVPEPPIPSPRWTPLAAKRERKCTQGSRIDCVAALMEQQPVWDDGGVFFAEPLYRRALASSDLWQQAALIGLGSSVMVRTGPDEWRMLYDAAANQEDKQQQRPQEIKVAVAQSMDTALMLAQPLLRAGAEVWYRDEAAGERMVECMGDGGGVDDQCVGPRSAMRTTTAIQSEPCTRPPFQPAERIGAGAWGTVSVACRTAAGDEDQEDEEDKCNYVIKRTFVDANDEDEQQRAARDPYFLQELAPYTLKGEDIVPRFFGAWTCPAPTDKHPNRLAVNVVMDRWDSDMETVAKERGERLRPGSGVMMYTVAELERMFQLMVALGELGIVHGDAKPNQFLWRDGDIVITDFGFAGGPKWAVQGELGWPGEAEGLSCPPAFTPLVCAAMAEQKVETETKDQRPLCPPSSLGMSYETYVNLVQLEMWMLLYDRPLVVASNETQVLGRFAGIHGLKRGVLHNVCRGYTDELAKAGLPADLRQRVTLSLPYLLRARAVAEQPSQEQGETEY